jgi:anti-anti-sigma factor
MSVLTEATWLEVANEAVRQSSVGEIVIDLSGVEQITSRELNELIRIQLLAKQLGNCLVLLNPQELISQVLTLTRLDRLIQLRYDQAHELPTPHF